RPIQVPGLNQDVTLNDVWKSRSLHNEQPDASAQGPIKEGHLLNLSDIFTKHDVHDLLGIHLAHRHGEIPENYMLLGEKSAKPLCRRAIMTCGDDVDLSKVHGHVFVVNDGRLHPYEYQQGPLMESVTRIDPAFFSDFIDYITANDLTSLVGLEVLILQFKDKYMSEIVYEGEALMWESKRLKYLKNIKTTGWTFLPGQYTGNAFHVADDKGHR
ncbi:hypothetical protein B0J13DRAFT_410551, partial [Dactylonectria estremocensis]